MTLNDHSGDLEQTAQLDVKLVEAGGAVRDKKSSIIREHFLEVFINERLCFKIVCTPANLLELVTGRLATEGIIADSTEIESVFICESAGRAKVYLNHDIEWENGGGKIHAEPTCCTDNKILADFSSKRELKVLKKAHYKPEWIFELADKFKENSALHKMTKGTHSCYLSYEGSFKCVFEDIGRHNALDKAVGYAVINGFDLSKCILFTTGRVPVDMARKALMAGVPVLVSKAVPTAEAVELAKKYNLTLICKAWPDSYEVFNE